MKSYATSRRPNFLNLVAVSVLYCSEVIIIATERYTYSKLNKMDLNRIFTQLVGNSTKQVKQTSDKTINNFGNTRRIKTTEKLQTTF